MINTTATLFNCIGCNLPFFKFRITRGNCRSCYTTLRREILAGRTTWEQLETEGKALSAASASGSVRRQLRRTMFLRVADTGIKAKD